MSTRAHWMRRLVGLAAGSYPMVSTEPLRPRESRFGGPGCVQQLAQTRCQRPRGGMAMAFEAAVQGLRGGGEYHAHTLVDRHRDRVISTNEHGLAGLHVQGVPAATGERPNRIRCAMVVGQEWAGDTYSLFWTLVIMPSILLGCFASAVAQGLERLRRQALSAELHDSEQFRERCLNRQVATRRTACSAGQ